MKNSKTTVEIRKPLLDAARKVAVREGISLRALIEQGLEHAIQEHKATKPFRLRRATFRGRGLQKGVREGDWSDLRDRIYEGRGT
ncbi:MAG: DUF2191 domain-containing protein [Thermoanaerobaculia bacterium]